MLVAISRVSTGSNERKCPYQGAVWDQKNYEWRVEIESLDSLMDEVGDIIVTKLRASTGVMYGITIYDARLD